MEILELLRGGDEALHHSYAYDEYDADSWYTWNGEAIDEDSMLQWLLWELLDSGVLTEVPITKHVDKVVEVT